MYPAFSNLPTCLKPMDAWNPSLSWLGTVTHAMARRTPIPSRMSSSSVYSARPTPFPRVQAFTYTDVSAAHEYASLSESLWA